jgi:hypothetical protein
MFIRKVIKKNKNGDKSYDYFRLTHSYRVGNKNRQQVILNLGTLEGVDSQKHKALADRIEEILTGSPSFFETVDSKIEELAQKYANQIIKKDLFPFSTKKENAEQSNDIKYVAVDLESAEEIESRDLGGEWVAKQAFDSLNINCILSSLGLEDKDILMAKALHLLKFHY